MASLDDLKKRIASVKSTQKITKAMKWLQQRNLEELKKVLRREDLIQKK